MCRPIKAIALIAVITFGMTGCFMPGTESPGSPEDLAQMAASAVDLKNL